MSRSSVSLSARSSKTFLQILSTSDLPAGSIRMSLALAFDPSHILRHCEQKRKGRRRTRDRRNGETNCTRMLGGEPLLFTASSVPGAAEEVGLGRRHRLPSGSTAEGERPHDE
jgi:hypothetical protein